MEGEYAIDRILISKIRWCKQKLKPRARSYSMDLKPWVLTDSVLWRKGPSEGEEGWVFYSRYNPALLPPRLSSLWHAGMRGAKGPNKVLRSTKERIEGWHDKRMRKKECDIGDKMLMNSSSKETIKQEEKITTQVIYLLSHGAITLQWRR